jgi:hypothetical protein
LKTHFHKRGYPRKIVKEAYDKVLAKTRDSLVLEPKPSDNPGQPENQLNFLITTHKPGFNIPRDVVTDNWPLRGMSNITNHLYESNVTYGNRRSISSGRKYPKKNPAKKQKQYAKQKTAHTALK